MSSRFLERVRLACALVLLGCCSQVQSRDLVVCADPDNLPFSHQDGSGFENRIAELVAQDLDARLVYRWVPLRRGAVRKTLGAGVCDVLIGVPADPAHITTTIAYYRSSYALLTRKDWGPPVWSFDDPRLRTSRIGVPLIGADGAAAPPASALARRGIVDNVTGFPVYGAVTCGATHGRCARVGADRHRRRMGPDGGLLRAAGQGSDRPRAGCADDDRRCRSRLRSPSRCATTRRALRDEIDAALDRDRSRIDAILAQYGVPLLPLHGTVAEAK